ncbi:MAG TPA: anti-sigma factor [Candidatus Angelobacter sp.]|nr:anti-sigma factor [Candidatus Angelobacter sp.]
MAQQRRLALILTLTFLFAVAVWGREDRLTNTGLNPAAQGKVTTETDRNGNTKIHVEVKHMATPASLNPAKQTYVVWVQPRGQSPEPLGVLRVNEELEGTLNAVAAQQDFDILITAEDTPNPAAPSDLVVLKGTIERSQK